jgi:hypothetical protein
MGMEAVSNPSLEVVASSACERQGVSLGGFFLDLDLDLDLDLWTMNDETRRRTHGEETIKGDE